MQEKSITKFLSEEYREFAFYTIENRAIASVIDGLKISQRKIINASKDIWKTGAEKHLKVFQLSGVVAHTQFYHHGNQSLDAAIINLAQKFKNNAPLLEEDGQFGSLRSPQSGAPRYIGTKLSKYFKWIYKDFELIDYKEEEGEKIEPQFFLPIVPVILINGSSGIAVGFASNILSRSIHEVIENCRKCLLGKKIQEIKPELPSFKGDFIRDEANPKRWMIRGKFEKLNHNTIKITELPPSMTYEKYEEVLDKLLENKEIVSYEDLCKDNINYTIKFTRSELESMGDEQIIKKLRLEESETEIFTTLDEHGKLRIFETSTQIIEHFVNFRLQYYQKRKDSQLQKLHQELKIQKNKGRFIKLILESKIKINDTPKLEITKQIEDFNFDKIDDSYDYLLRMPIYSLTKEVFEKLKSEFLDKKQEIEKLQLVDPKELYLSDIEDLKKNLK